MVVIDQHDNTPNDYNIFRMGDLHLQEGMTLPDAKLYSGTHWDNEWLIGKGMALDPENFFIVVPNLFGNGLSSSPSNQSFPYNGPNFPKVTLYDNITAQYRLITEHLGIKKIFAVLGWSMGGMQSYQWGALYSDIVERIVPFCCSAKTSVHNIVFLEGPKSALMADANFDNGNYVKPHDVQRGLRAFGRVYAGWGLSQAFYREKLYLKMGYQSLEDFLVGFWEGYFLKKDPNNLLAMLWSWQKGDISYNPVFNGDFKKALSAIKCKSLVMPGSTDLYFPPEDNLAEVKEMPNAKYLPIDSIWGHWAGGPGTNKDDVKFLDKTLKEFFSN
ncbi:hypothetical protein HK099_007511 [Clydaea vesicula]|uniref:AB hydrolase-1 domain-containing protein n=1 Tax=Clydaea vesicula TaxID=447962 RepID=A0AAD5XWC6_9FUNG|nr:hypothetical protein HK099_007511 [Clydaea vesicula]